MFSSGVGGNAKWWGLAGYLRYNLGESPLVESCPFMADWYVAFRGEGFSDQDGSRTGYIPARGHGGVDFQEYTTTLGYQPWESLLTRFEYRYDVADDPVFEVKHNRLKNTQHTFAFDVVVFF